MKYISYIIIALSIISCDTRFDKLERNNKTPNLTISKHLNSWNIDTEDYITVINDSVKYGTDYKIAYRLEEEESNVSILVEENDGVTLYEGNILKDSTIATGSGNLVFRGQTQNVVNKIKYIAIDGFEKQHQVNLNLTTFDNLPPVARFNTVTKTNLNQNLEYNISLSKSYDRDSKFGGNVINYVLLIDSAEFLSPASNFDYTFNSPGTYKIGIKVMDNDSAWSELVEENFVIQ